MVYAIAEIVKDIRYLAEHLVCERRGGNEIAAAAPSQLGRGQQYSYGIARMAGAIRKTDEGVVEIEISDHHAVGENCQIGARPDAAEQDRGALPCNHVVPGLDPEL